MDKICALLLAAGKGTRMHSAKPKVLQTLLGEPILGLLVDKIHELMGADIYAVVGYGAEQIALSYPKLKLIKQEEQLGTAHAVQTALPTLKAQGYEQVLVINGDTPLVTKELLETFLTKAKGYDLALATLELKDPQSFGRIIRQNGEIKAIVEAKDYQKEIYGEPSGEINAGLYSFKMDLLETLLPKVIPSRQTGEYYLTDLVALALAQNYKVLAQPLGHDLHLLGINSPEELINLEEHLRAEIVQSYLKKGVILHAPNLIRISPKAKIEPGAEITGPCEIYGSCEIKANAKIFSHCVLQDSLVESGAEIRSFSHLEGAIVGEGCLVGPFARLRPLAVLERESHVGNFVELKKTRLGAYAKANHLTYLGDAEIGSKTNIGAGTITCNYDGHHKYQTKIGEGAFIGSNTSLVAPVKVGAGALIGAGSTITHDIPEENLAVARSKQKNYPHKPLPKED